MDDQPFYEPSDEDEMEHGLEHGSWPPDESDDGDEPRRRYTKEERLRLYDRMLEMKYRERASWEEVAEKHGVARSTVRRWRLSDEWRIAEARWRRVMREEARSDVAMIGQDMVSVLQDLAHNARSEFTRYSAASKLLDLFGVGEELEETRVDQTTELMRFMQSVAAKRDEEAALASQGYDMRNVIDVEVKPGGFLPDEVTARNEALKARALGARAELEAEMEEDD